ncbi:sigma factor-like helix-turn-helix DNA-binding protein [Streptomyces sp. NPDC020412]|uniref:sigma factor-like helix-turn-helix DNA-binding protein n=1 Tax=Streptomyces sp. NPDC020412 TaxID=3365073 RepID=UPI00379C8C7B
MSADVLTRGARLFLDEDVSERQRSVVKHHRARQFEAFMAGAGGRLLHAATLLTSETTEDNPHARRLLTAALAHTYAEWGRLRGEDPYERTRRQLAIRFARCSWRFRRARGGVLQRLTPCERLVLVLRLYEGVPEEQAAALLGLPVERIHTVCERAVAAAEASAAGPDCPASPTSRTGPTGLAGPAGSAGFDKAEAAEPDGPGEPSRSGEPDELAEPERPALPALPEPPAPEPAPRTARG